MSDFRKFCIALSISAGLLAAADNHGLMSVSAQSLALLSLYSAAAFVSLFGRRLTHPGDSHDR